MLSINISELVLTAASFFLLLFLLNKFLYKPVLKFMRERDARVSAQLETEREAEAAVAEAEAGIAGEKCTRREKAKALLAKSAADNAKAHEDCADRIAEESAKERREAKARLEDMSKDAGRRFAEKKDELAGVLAERLMGK